MRETDMAYLKLGEKYQMMKKENTSWQKETLKDRNKSRKTE